MTATTEIYTRSLHDALPILVVGTYETVADVDEYGTVKSSLTKGFSGKTYSEGVDLITKEVNLDGSYSETTGYYSTTATNNGYGMMVAQVTKGASYNNVDGDWVVVGTYETVADVDEYGTEIGRASCRERV